ncbi:LOW QUALITY PROTEIN: olfactomedin-like [Ctenopharyngodon idella]|uniref:LOW QUALITY PROTEIN: olfactomedin-like n=1 Tax=Ctenopharyngodon idella TaxID=7959 RepID=UPI00223161BE|nr:LOW QUALITY PROTEIN: olfactomedin-like [Ctenopharyngodon idella]
MFVYLLLLTVIVTVEAQRVPGLQKTDSCLCKINSSIWTFPAVQFVEVTKEVQTCEDNLNEFEEKLRNTDVELPSMGTNLQNITARLEVFNYLHTSGLYNALHLRQLNQELEEIHRFVSEAHMQNPNKETHNLLSELNKAKKDVQRMYKDDFFNLETMKKRLQDLNNRAQTCKTIPNDFRSTCHQHIMTRISSPRVTKLNSISKSYISGAWGRDALLTNNRYWERCLVSGNKHGNTIRVYNSHEDFMASKNYKDEQIASSYSDKNAVQGSGTILYDNTVFYQCYETAEICSFNITSQSTKRVKLDGARIDNKFPFCYYSCRDWTDIDLEADQDAVWVIYATEENHGNIVVSRLDPLELNITHTWKTHLFKRSVTSTFMVCGVLYATRYVSNYQEEVFYAFDTTTGKEINTLSLPFEKVSAGIANLNYNPVDRRLYMYNDGYLLAYNTFN